MTMNTERRKFIAGVGAATASTAVLAGGQALAQGNQQTGAKALPYPPYRRPHGDCAVGSSDGGR
jgi:hypothetical protein